MAEGSAERGKMTLRDLRGVVAILSNSCFVRYWIGWNNHSLCPPEGEPSLMALCAINEKGEPADVYERDLERRGFSKDVHEDGLEFWVVERVDDEGRPWRSAFRD